MNAPIESPLFGISSRLPPSNVQAEQALLGAVLMNNRAMDMVTGLKPEHFADPIHGFIFAECRRLIDGGRTADPVTLKGVLEHTGALNEVGGTAYLTHLMTAMVSVNMAGDYARVIRDAWTRRQVIDIGAEAVDLAYGARTDIDGEATVSKALDRLMALGAQTVSNAPATIADALDEAMDAADAACRGEGPGGLLTGIPSLDDLWGGLWPANLDCLGARSEHGKAQPLDAAILMASGRWKRMGDLRIGDALASVDGAPSTVSGIFPRGVMPTFRVTLSDTRSAVVSADHLWRVYSFLWKEPKVLPTSEVAALLQTERWKKKLYIEEISGDFGELSHEDLPIEPYVLGCLLGDGDLSHVTPRLTSADKELVDEIQRRLGISAVVKPVGSDGISYSILSTVYEQVGPYGRDRRRKREMYRALVSLGLHGCVSETKFIPDIYFRGTRQVRLDLLRGLMDTDGYAEKNTGCVGYSSCSRRLAEGVQALVRSLGGHCYIAEKHPFYSYKGERRAGQVQYRCGIRYGEVKELFLLQRKSDMAFRLRKPFRLRFRSIEPLDEQQVQCISVTHPSRLYVTDEYTVTHNTALGLQIAVNVARGLLAEHDEAIAAGEKHTLEHVELYSLEMPRDHLALRMLATETSIPARDIRAGKISGARAEALIRARGVLRRLPILIRDTPSMSITDIVMGARVSRRRRHTRLIVIDHLHRIAPAETKARLPRNEQVQSITEALKTLASSMKIPILLLAQLSRQAERREDHRPNVADIEYAGERDFDNIALLWRPELYMGEKPPSVSDKLGDEKKAEIESAWWRRREEVRGKAEVILAKTRMGGVGSVWLNFDGPRTRFTQAADYHDPQGGMF